MSAYYNEIDPYAAQWLRNLITAGHIAPGDVDERSIEDVRPDDLKGYAQCHFFAGIGVWSFALRKAGWDDGRPVWTGSCPCQSFSAAGQRKGFADERHLWPAWHHLIAERRPPAVFGEQVSSKDAMAWLDLVQADLEGLDYACGALVAPAAGVGAPHIRSRLYFAALDNAADKRFSQRAREAVFREETCGIGQRSGDVDGLAHHHQRSQGRDERGDGSRQCAAGPGLLAGGVDDSNVIRTQRTRTKEQIFSAGRENGELEYIERPGPLNGFWRDADWLFCRDGKWRPVEPIHVKMVDGSSENVVRLRSGNKNQEKINELLGLPQDFKEKDFQQRQERRSIDVEASKILRQEVYGERAEEEHLPQFKPQQDEGEFEYKKVLRGLREERGFTSPSQRRKSSEQQKLELDDIVQVLPQSLSLAELYGYGETAETLRALQKSIYEKRSVLYASKPVQEVWASLGEKEANEIRMGFDASRWELVVPFPLKKGVKNRTGQLRAYGNAINAEQAENFIRSYLEISEGFSLI